MNRTALWTLFAFGIILIYCVAYPQQLWTDMLPHEITACEDEPVVLTLIASNPTTRTIEVGMNPDCYTIRITPIQGPPNDYTFRPRREGFVPLPESLPPGARLEASIPFPYLMGTALGWDSVRSGYWDVTFEPGKYIVQWEYEQVLAHAQPLGFQPKGTLELTVLPRDEKRLLTRYEELVQSIESLPPESAKWKYNAALTPLTLLRRVRDPQAAPIVARLLAHKHWLMRIRTIHVLTDIGTPECVRLLENFQKESTLTPEEQQTVSRVLNYLKNK